MRPAWALSCGCKSRRKETILIEAKLLELVVERSNVEAALRRVKKNKGGPGIDGMTVEELPAYLARLVALSMPPPRAARDPLEPPHHSSKRSLRARR